MGVRTVVVAIHRCTSHSCKSWDTVTLTFHSFGEAIDKPQKIIDLVAVAELSVVGEGSVDIIS